MCEKYAMLLCFAVNRKLIVSSAVAVGLLNRWGAKLGIHRGLCPCEQNALFCLCWEKAAAVQGKSMAVSCTVHVYQTLNGCSWGKSKLHTALLGLKWMLIKRKSSGLTLYHLFLWRARTCCNLMLYGCCETSLTSLPVSVPEKWNQ